MEITIKLDDKTADAIIKKGAEALTAEECKDIVKQAMLKAFQEVPDFKDMLIKHDRVGFSEYSEIKLGPLASKMLEASVSGCEFDDVRDMMVDALKKNHRQILENAMLGVITDRICCSRTFEEHIRVTMSQILSENRQ